MEQAHRGAVPPAPIEWGRVFLRPHLLVVPPLVALSRSPLTLLSASLIYLVHTRLLDRNTRIVARSKYSIVAPCFSLIHHQIGQKDSFCYECLPHALSIRMQKGSTALASEPLCSCAGSPLWFRHSEAFYLSQWECPDCRRLTLKDFHVCLIKVFSRARTARVLCLSVLNVADGRQDISLTIFTFRVTACAAITHRTLSLCFWL